MKNIDYTRYTNVAKIPFGLKLKRLRLYKKMSQTQFGKIYGCDQAQISRYENGLEPLVVNQFVALVNFMYNENIIRGYKNGSKSC